MNVIKSKNFKSGSFKNEEHSFISSINEVSGVLNDYGDVLPEEPEYFENAVNPKYDIELNDDEGGANIKKYVPLVHRDLEIILYRGVCYILSGIETNFYKISEDVMNFIKNMVRIVGSKITITNHIASICDARDVQAVEVHDNNDVVSLAVPSSYSSSYEKCGHDGAIKLFDTVGKTDRGLKDVMLEHFSDVSCFAELQEICNNISKGLMSLGGIVQNGHSSEKQPKKSHGGLRLGYLSDVIHAMASGVEHFAIKAKDEQIKKQNELHDKLVKA